MDQALPPALPNDPMTDFFWEAARNGELHIQRCQACGTYIHQPRPICRNCQSFDLAGEKVSGRGVIYSFTQTFRAFHPFFVDRVPYVLATIALVEQPGLHIVSNIVGVAADQVDELVRIGMDVQVEFEQLAEGYMLPVFRTVTAPVAVSA
jgi:uncharacterized protein